MWNARRLCAGMAAVLLMTGCLASNSNLASTKDGSGQRSVSVPSGTAIEVRLTSGVSSETARRGDSWTGSVTSAVTSGDRVLIPAGTPVRGTVSVARAAQRGTRAEIGLEMHSVMMHGESYKVEATSEPVIAGSPRARNLGAIAGGAAAGALLGKAIGGDGHDALIGGVLGGAAAGGAVAASKGYQVRLQSGTVMTFRTPETVALH